MGAARVCGGHGSGFVVADNLILTNNHVAGNAKNATIKMDSDIEFVGEVVRSTMLQFLMLIIKLRLKHLKMNLTLAVRREVMFNMFIVAMMDYQKHTQVLVV